MKRHPLLWALVLSPLLLLPQPLQAIGKLFGRIPWHVNSPIYNLGVKSLNVDVTIAEQLVSTTIVQEFTNESWYQLEGVFVFELPPTAKVTSLALWKGGERILYDLKTLAAAREVYPEIVIRANDPLFPKTENGNVFRLRLFPIEAQATCKIEFAYFYLLDRAAGKCRYSFPLNLAAYTDTPIQAGQIQVQLNSQFPLTEINAPLATEVIQSTPNRCQIHYTIQNLIPVTDFSVDYKLDQGGSFFNLLTYTPEMANEENYYALWITPPDSLFQDTILVKEIVFVIDQSASMGGVRLNQLKQSLSAFIDQLNPVDRFNIIPFSSTVSLFRPELVFASPAMKQAAKIYLSQLTGDALANMEGALMAAVNQKFTAWTRRSILLFTDSRPNIGVKDNVTILQHIQAANGDDVSIFPVGIGNEVDPTLLNNLALQNKGYPFYLLVDDSLAADLNTIYPQIVVPALTDITLNYQSIQTLDLFPRQISNMVKNVQQLIRGRYVGTGSVRLQLTGAVGKTPVKLSGNANFLPSSDFQVARLWAASKIDYYLSLIAQYGEEAELVQAVVNFSQQYGILTPYTAFILIEAGSNPPSGLELTPASQLPAVFTLEQNFPNPFNPSTMIPYQINGAAGQRQWVTLKIFNQLGECLTTLVAEAQLPGKYLVNWSGRDAAGLPVATGTYYYRLQIGTVVTTRAMVFVK